MAISFRKEKMGEAIRKVVTDKLSRDKSPIPNAFLTVNKVDVTSDYAWAKIFYSVFGAKINEDQANLIMKGQASAYRYEISQKLNLRKTPKIEFCFDKNTEYAFKIDSLLSDNSQ